MITKNIHPKYNINFQGYNEALNEWNSSKPDIQAALAKLNKQVTTAIPGISFPAAAGEDIGIGSPYSSGAGEVREFFSGFVTSNILGPWGKTYRGPKDYSMHSPYLSTLDSLNPFFINFKYLTTGEGGNLVKPETFASIVANKPKEAISSSIAVPINYNYGEKAVNQMLDEAFDTYTERLIKQDSDSIKLSQQISTFKNENPGIVLDAVYESLVEKYGTDDISKWDKIARELPVLLNKKDEQAALRLKVLCEGSNQQKIEKYLFAQFLAASHAENPKLSPFKYIADKQVAIIGQDAWKLQDLLLTEIDGHKISLGVPADMFSPEGRCWGMNILDPHKLFDEKGNITEGGERIYNLFRKVFHKNRGGLRLDHFIGVIDPYVCINGSPRAEDGAGRLLSSPDNRILGKYAIRESPHEAAMEKYSLIFEKIILRAAQDEGLSAKDIIPEDIGALTDPVRAVMEKHGLSSMKVTSFVNPEQPNHTYRGQNALPKDSIAIGNHDTQPAISYFADMSQDIYSRHAKMLSGDTKISEASLHSASGRVEALKAKFAELFISPAQNVHMFFSHLMGYDSYFNKPGDSSVNKWRIRMSENFRRDYFENLRRGTAFNPFDALIKAFNALGIQDNITNVLKAHQENLLKEIEDMIKKEQYNPFVTGLQTVEERNERFPQDAVYRKTLANALGETNPDKLGSIIGLEELKAILSSVSPSYFKSAGETPSGMPINPDQRINIHLHSVASDGEMPIREGLEKAAEYASKTGKPFLFGWTDHDTLDGIKEAIRIIAGDPERYKNVLFMPGIELNTKYRSNKIFGASKSTDFAIQLETIGYCVNPFDEKLNAFISRIREGNKATVNQIIAGYNQWGLNASLDGARDLPVHLRYVGSPGLLPSLKSYIQGLFARKGWEWSNPQAGVDAEQIFRRITAPFGRETLTAATPAYSEVINAVKESGFGAVGIAHPARIDLKGIDVNGDFAIKTLLDDFVRAGGQLIETNYQYPPNASMTNWIRTIREYVELKWPNIFRAGGMDGHARSLFVR